MRRAGNRKLRSSNFPHHACNADLLTSLLVVVEPFVFGEVNAGKFGARVCSCRQELSLEQGYYGVQALSTQGYTNLSLELCEFQPPAVELEYVDRLRWVCPFVCLGRRLDVG